jgi:hypothetical protein
VKPGAPAKDVAAFAEALGLSTPELITRLRPVAADGRREIPSRVRNRLARAVARLNAAHLPDVIVEHTRRSACDVATDGWRPTIDPGVWIPDAAEIAATVDPGHRPHRPPTVTADISALVLLAIRCTAVSGVRGCPAG